MNAESVAMETNKMWYVVPLPSRHHSMGCKRIYKVKHQADKIIERYKTRLVAMGYTQCGKTCHCKGTSHSCSFFKLVSYTT